MTESILVQPVFDTENISDKLFSPLSLRHIRAVNIKERVRLNDVRRDLDLACKMTVFEIDHASKSMRKRQEKLRAQLQSRRGRATATSSGDSFRVSRSNTWHGKVKSAFYYNGAASIPLVGGGTVRANSGGNGRDKRPRKATNVIAFSGENDADDIPVPEAAVNKSGLTLPLIVVQSPDGTANRTLSSEARVVINGGDDHVINDDDHFLATILQADDAEQGHERSLHVPAMRIDPKGRFVEVTEGDYESTNSFSHNTRHTDTTHMSVDAYQKMLMFPGDKLQNDNTTETSGEKNPKNRAQPERMRHADTTQNSTFGDTYRKTGPAAHQVQYPDAADTSVKTDNNNLPMLSHNMFSLPPLYSLKPGRHRWRDLSGTVTTDPITAGPQLRDVKWCRYLRYPSGKGRPSDVPAEYA